MASDLSLQFVEYLRQGKHLTSVDGRDDAVGQVVSDRRRANLWELTDLSAAEFADEAARFYGLERVTLQDMMSAAPLVASFSQRFLREMLVFPYQSNGRAMVAVADPTDVAVQRAVQIVLGAGVVIRIATSEDLAVVLNQRLGEDDVDPAAELAAQPREDDIESLRDLASGAPVVRAVNDLLEKAVELRASDIHIEPFPAGLVVRMRIDGLLRPVVAPAGVLPRALISRIKIVANLNIA
jgi:general secretion pathway protein E